MFSLAWFSGVHFGIFTKILGDLLGAVPKLSILGACLGDSLKLGIPGAALGVRLEIGEILGDCLDGCPVFVLLFTAL